MKIYLIICTRHREFGIFNFLRYLRLLLLCKVHRLGKRWFFREIFQVGACPNLEDSSLYDRLSIHMYKAWCIRFLWLFLRYLRLLNALLGTSTGKRWFLMKYFKSVHAPTWKIPKYMKIFLFICTRHREFGIFNFFALSATPFCFARYIILEKKCFFHEIFQVGACPNLKDSSLYDRFSFHMYKAWSFQFLWLFCAICDSLMPCTINLFFLEKDEFSWNITSWCMPQLENFLNIWIFSIYMQRHRVRYLRLFALSATP